MRTLLFSLLLLCSFAFTHTQVAAQDVTTINFKGEDVLVNGTLFFTGYMKGEEAMVDLYVQYDTDLGFCVITRVTKPDEFAGKVNDKEIDVYMMFLSEINLEEDVQAVKEDGFYVITMYPHEGKQFTRKSYKRLKAKPVDENANFVEWIFYSKADADRYAEELYNYIIEAR